MASRMRRAPQTSRVVEASTRTTAPPPSKSSRSGMRRTMPPPSTTTFATCIVWRSTFRSRRGRRDSWRPSSRRCSGRSRPALTSCGPVRRPVGTPPAPHPPADARIRASYGRADSYRSFYAPTPSSGSSRARVHGSGLGPTSRRLGPRRSVPSRDPAATPDAPFALGSRSRRQTCHHIGPPDT